MPVDMRCCKDKYFPQLRGPAQGVRIPQPVQGLPPGNSRAGIAGMPHGQGRSLAKSRAESPRWGCFCTGSATTRYVITCTRCGNCGNYVYASIPRACRPNRNLTAGCQIARHMENEGSSLVARDGTAGFSHTSIPQPEIRRNFSPVHLAPCINPVCRHQAQAGFPAKARCGH
jgi:hypothetical protein